VIGCDHRGRFYSSCLSDGVNRQAALSCANERDGKRIQEKGGWEIKKNVYKRLPVEFATAPFH
jgi:hypothetical protein